MRNNAITIYGDINATYIAYPQLLRKMCTDVYYLSLHLHYRTKVDARVYNAKVIHAIKSRRLTYRGNCFRR